MMEAINMVCKICKKELGTDDNLFCEIHRKKWRNYCKYKKIDSINLKEKIVNDHLNIFIRR
jgi:hypothetical protein